MSTASVQQKPESIRAGGADNEEESFIILGSGPSSMASGSFMQTNSMSFIDTDTINRNGLANGMQQMSLKSATSMTNGMQATHSLTPTNAMNGDAKSIGSNGVEVESFSMGSFKSLDGNFRSMSDFASKFLLGEINQDAVRSSVFEAFPSINTTQTKVDDVLKLYSLLDEHAQLKTNLEQTNQAMRRSALVIQEYQDKTKQKLNQKNREIVDMTEQLKAKDTENRNLVQAIGDLEGKTRELNQIIKGLEEKKELLQVEVKAVHIDMQESAQKAAKNQKILENEIEAYKMAVSEKDAIIRNMAEQIHRLETDREAFVMVSSAETKSKTAASSNVIPKNEHDSIVRELRHQLSQVTAENLEITDMKKVYGDELNCLKVNLTSAEEVHKQMQATITTLRASSMEHSKRAEQYAAELKNAREQIELLNAQVDVYRTDFQQERSAREKLVTEKEDILADLQLLQKRNKELIDDAQKRLSTSGASQPGPSRSTGAIKKAPSTESPKSRSPEKQEEIKYICPICNQESESLKHLEQHIEACLKE